MSCCTCSPVTCIIPFFIDARATQLSSTHLRYFTPFFVLYLTYCSWPSCSYLNPVLHCSLLTFAMFCKTFFRTLTDNVTTYVRVQGVRVSLCHFQQIPTLPAVSYTRFLYFGVYVLFPLPAVSSPGHLHAVSVTRKFHTPIKGFTRRFHYTRIQSTRLKG